MALSDFNRDINFFRNLPWTQTLLEDPAYLAVPTPSRTYKRSTEDAVIAETLNTQDTIKAWLTMHKKPTSGDGLITETRTLLSLGHGVNGYLGLVHGVIVGLIIDEAMGTMLQLNTNAVDADIMGFIVTAYLKTNFLRPVRTPSIVLLTAELKKRKERKLYINAKVENEARDLLATGAAVWIQAKEPQAHL